MVHIACHVNIGPIESRVPVLFEPNPEHPWSDGVHVPQTLVTVSRGGRINIQVENTTSLGATLRKRKLLGQLHLVRSATPVKVTKRDTCDGHDPDSVQVARAKASETPVDQQNHPEELGFVPEVNLDGLSEKPRDIVDKMLAEGAESFATGDAIGDAEDLMMDINLTDPTPVQRTYTAVPRSLHPEVKHYVEDLLNRGWITRSRSAYSSPVVCVRKKDGSLRLCIDYRLLNQKTTADGHPIPRVQATLDSLGGNRWFLL